MKVKIIVAPQTNPDPYWKPLMPLGAASIVSYLKEKGYEAELDDLDIKNIVAERELSNKYQKIDMEPFRQMDRVKEYLLGIKKDNQIEKMTERLLSWTNYEGYDLIAISMATRPHQLMPALCMAKKIKENTNATVMIGGRRIYPEILEEYDFIDYGMLVDTGPGMEKILKFIQNNKNIEKEQIPMLMFRKNGEVQMGPPPNIDMEKTRYPDYGDLLKNLYMYHSHSDFNKNYHPKKLLLLPYHAVEGCVGKCAFCSGNSQKLIPKSINKISGEIKQMKKEFNTDSFMFQSNEININYNYMDELTKELKKLNILWTDSARLDVFDEKLMKQTAESGCVHLTYGLESGSQQLLDKMNKGIDLEHASNIIKWSTKYGIWNHINVIAGMPYETDEDIQKTIDFINNNAENIHSVTITKFFIAYNSPLEKYPEKYGLKKRKTKQIRFSNVKMESNVFDEVEGLKWEEKQEQQEKSVQMLIENIKIPVRSVVAIPALFYLYSIYGRDIKKIKSAVKENDLLKPYGLCG